MKTALYSISKIFTERLLRIPDYQRGYAWNDKQLKDFWNDIIQLEIGKNHYTGVLTLEDVPQEHYAKWTDDLWIIESKSYDAHYIVDGQQRLTTSIILIQCILEKIGPEGMLNFTASNTIRDKFIFESKPGGISRSYVFGYVSDNPSYDYLKYNIFGEVLDDQINIQETIYTNNLENSKSFFTEKLATMEVNDIEIIYKKLTQHFLYNIYSMSKDIDVHVSFETMNNRGKSLSHLELLKNRLIYLSTLFIAEEHEKLKLRKAINECWKTIYHQLGRNKDNPLDDDEFLLTHFIITFGSELSDSEMDSVDYRFIRRGYRSNYKNYLLEHKFTTKSLKKNNGSPVLTIPKLYTYVKSLKSSVETWFDILNPDFSGLNKDIVIWLKKVNRTDVTPVLPLLMVYFQKIKTKNERVSFLKVIEKMIFSLLLTKRSYLIQANPSSFIDWAGEFSSGTLSSKKLVSKIEEFRASIATDNMFIYILSDSFKEGNFYKWSGLKYFLYEYEQSLKMNSKTYREKLSWETLLEDDRDHKTIEHIYPQRAMAQCWKDAFNKYSSKERTILRHSLGNLVPLSGPKNSSFQNKPFLEKIGNNDNTIGFKYGSYSEIELTSLKDWNAEEILRRGFKLLGFMEKRWGVTIAPGARVHILNLDFVMAKENLKIEKGSIVSKV